MWSTIYQVFAVAVCGLTVLSHASSSTTQKIDTQPYPYDFPKLGTNGSDLFPMRLCNGFKLEEASIDDIQAELGSGKLSAVQLLKCYYDRIYQLQPYLK